MIYTYQMTLVRRPFTVASLRLLRTIPQEVLPFIRKAWLLGLSLARFFSIWKTMILA